MSESEELEADRDFYEELQSRRDTAASAQMLDSYIAKYIDDRPFDDRRDNVKRAIRRLRTIGHE